MAANDHTSADQFLLHSKIVRSMYHVSTYFPRRRSSLHHDLSFSLEESITRLEARLKVNTRTDGAIKSYSIDIDSTYRNVEGLEA